MGMKGASEAEAGDRNAAQMMRSKPAGPEPKILGRTLPGRNPNRAKVAPSRGMAIRTSKAKRTRCGFAASVRNIHAPFHQDSW